MEDNHNFKESHLLSKGEESLVQFRNEISSLLRKRDYFSVIAKYDDNSSYLKYDRYILILVKTYLEILNSKKIPINNNSNGSNDRQVDVYIAIDLGDYTLAVRLCNKFKNKRGFSSTNNSLYLILKDIINLIKKYEIEASKVLSEKDMKILSEYRKIFSQSNDVVLLSGISEEELQRLNNIFDTARDINIYSFKSGNTYDAVIKKRIKKEAAKELADKVKDEYHNANYRDALRDYLTIINFSNKLNSFCFLRVGFCYLHLGEKEKAIKYLSIANLLYIKEGKKEYDYGNLILELQGLISKEDLKPVPKTTIEDFNDDEFFGINNFPEFDLFLKSSGFDIQSAGRYFNMTEEDIEIVRLLYAREYYSAGYIKEGDMFIREVEKCKNKTPRINKYLSLVRDNKIFYQKRGIKRILITNGTIKP